jgi:hypothetical protein
MRSHFLVANANQATGNSQGGPEVVRENRCSHLPHQFGPLLRDFQRRRKQTFVNHLVSHKNGIKKTSNASNTPVGIYVTVVTEGVTEGDTYRKMSSLIRENWNRLTFQNRVGYRELSHCCALPSRLAVALSTQGDRSIGRPLI